MALGKAKLKVDDHVTYNGLRATVLKVMARKVEIRNAYGYVEVVNKSDCQPYTG